jgi:hypothetical protein
VSARWARTFSPSQISPENDGAGRRPARSDVSEENRSDVELPCRIGAYSFFRKPPPHRGHSVFQSLPVKYRLIYPPFAVDIRASPTQKR